MLARALSMYKPYRNTNELPDYISGSILLKFAPDFGLTATMETLPKKISEPVELVPRQFGKTLLLQKFHNPRLGGEEEYILFDSDTKPVVVFALTEARAVIAIKQFRYAANLSLVELPGGNAQPGESPEAAARRELEEETGFQPATVATLTKNPIWFDSATLTTPFMACLALGCRRTGKPQPDPDEHFEVLTFDIPEWIARIENGGIRDAKSIVATFLALPYITGEAAKPQIAG